VRVSRINRPDNPARRILDRRAAGVRERPVLPRAVRRFAPWLAAPGEPAGRTWCADGGQSFAPVGWIAQRRMQSAPRQVRPGPRPAIALMESAQRVFWTGGTGGRLAECQRRIAAYLAALDEPKPTTLKTLRRTIIEELPDAGQASHTGCPPSRFRARLSPGS